MRRLMVFAIATVVLILGEHSADSAPLYKEKHGRSASAHHDIETSEDRPHADEGDDDKEIQERIAEDHESEHDAHGHGDDDHDEGPEHEADFWRRLTPEEVAQQRKAEADLVRRVMDERKKNKAAKAAAEKAANDNAKKSQAGNEEAKKSDKKVEMAPKPGKGSNPLDEVEEKSRQTPAQKNKKDSKVAQDKKESAASEKKEDGDDDRDDGERFPQARFHDFEDGEDDEDDHDDDALPADFWQRLREDETEQGHKDEMESNSEEINEAKKSDVGSKNEEPSTAKASDDKGTAAAKEKATGKSHDNKAIDIPGKKKAPQKDLLKSLASATKDIENSLDEVEESGKEFGTIKKKFDGKFRGVTMDETGENRLDGDEIMRHGMEFDPRFEEEEMERNPERIEDDSFGMPDDDYFDQ